MTHVGNRQIHAFQEKILAWYKENKRDLPWRETHDPYKILVSEVMLQQTQVQRVLTKYEEWLQAFPTVFELARASNAEVLKHWSGLGYNRRALFLKGTAQVVVSAFNGKFPDSENALLSFPGIGKYTARALLCFAFKKHVAVVDTNVRKVILTQLVYKQALPEKDLEVLANQLLPANSAYDWNQALMDYSSVMLKKEKISIPKQATFIGSDRYFRGGILRLLLRYKKLSVHDIQKYLASDEQKEISFERLTTILRTMQKDTLIRFDARHKVYAL